MSWLGEIFYCFLFMQDSIVFCILGWVMSLIMIQQVDISLKEDGVLKEKFLFLFFEIFQKFRFDIRYFLFLFLVYIIYNILIKYCSYDFLFLVILFLGIVVQEFSVIRSFIRVFSF